MSELVKVDPNEYGVEESKAEELTTGLKPHLQERELLIKEFEKIKDLELTEENCEVFKRLRLKFRNNRTKGINDWHRSAKEIPLRLGQLIDAVKRSEVQVNETYEQKLEEGEKHFERLEAQRIEKLRDERWGKLQKYREEEPNGLGEMDEDVFKNLLAGAKAAYEKEQEEIRKAEEERKEQERLNELRRARELELAPYSDFIELEDPLETFNEKDYNALLTKAKQAKSDYLKEQERIRKQNERLQKEREEERKKHEKAEAERKEKERKEREAYEVQLKKEREERERLEAKELKRKEEEAAKLKEQEEAAREAELAPDKDKLKALANTFQAVELPKLKDEKAKELLSNVEKLQQKISDYILSNVEDL